MLPSCAPLPPSLWRRGPFQRLLPPLGVTVSHINSSIWGATHPPDTLFPLVLHLSAGERLFEKSLGVHLRVCFGSARAHEGASVPHSSSLHSLRSGSSRIAESTRRELALKETPKRFCEPHLWSVLGSV